MQRYILNEETKTFYKSDIHHITKVMRMNDGDEIIVCLNNECFYANLIINNNNVSYQLNNKINNNKTLDITLVQGLLKGNKLDTTIKYATIFGAKQFILTPFERSISKLKNTDFKEERYFNIAKEAAELSHREMIPKIVTKASLKSIDWQQFDLIILADENETNILKDFDKNEYLNKKIAIIIGPEGGISENERNYFKTLNVLSVSLGNYIFPAEIAAISLLNSLNN